MPNTTTQPTTITRFDFNNEMQHSLNRLSFLHDAISYWNCKDIPLNEEQLWGYGLLCEDVIKRIKELVDSLEK